jgi:hypothetical protein
MSDRSVEPEIIGLVLMDEGDVVPAYEAECGMCHFVVETCRLYEKDDRTYARDCSLCMP